MQTTHLQMLNNNKKNNNKNILTVLQNMHIIYKNFSILKA